MATEKGDSPTPPFCSKTRREKYATLYNMVFKKRTVFSIMTGFSLTDDLHGFVCDICKKKKLKNIVFNRSATVKLSEAGGVSKWYCDQKMTSFSFRFYKCLFHTSLAKS